MIFITEIIFGKSDNNNNGNNNGNKKRRYFTKRDDVPRIKTNSVSPTKEPEIFVKPSLHSFQRQSTLPNGPFIDAKSDSDKKKIYKYFVDKNVRKSSQIVPTEKIKVDQSPSSVQRQSTLPDGSFLDVFDDPINSNHNNETIESMESKLPTKNKTLKFLVKLPKKLV